MVSEKNEVGLFIELNTKVSSGKELIYEYLNKGFHSDYFSDTKFNQIRRFFSVPIDKYSGDESDFYILNEVRDKGLSSSLLTYVEALICGCKKHFKDSKFPFVFSIYANDCFGKAKVNDSFSRLNLEYFLGFEASRYKIEYNNLFVQFISSLGNGEITTFQMFVLGYFLNWYDSLDDSNRCLFIDCVLKKAEQPKDDIAFVNSLLSLIDKLILKNKKNKKLKIAYANVANGLQTTNPHFEGFLMQKPYQKALSFLAEAELDDPSLYDSLTAKLRFANEKALSSLQKIEVTLEPHGRKDLCDYLEKLETIMKNKSFQESLFLLFDCLRPFSIEKIKKDILDEKNSSIVGALFEDSDIDEDGNLLNGRDLKDYERFSLDARIPIINLFSTTYVNFIICFLRANNDRINYDFIHVFVEGIVSNNKMIAEQDKTEMTVIFENLFLNKFDEKFNDLCSQFENSLRFWLSAKGISTKKMKPNSSDVIGLSDIFNYGKNNRYRDAIKTIIDDDEYFTLTWMLNDDFGWNLRNKAVHGQLTGDKKKTYNVLFASLMIFELYLANWFD